MIKISQLCKDIGMVGLVGSWSIYILGYMGVGIARDYHMKNNPLQPAQLEKIIEREKEKLGLKDVEISVGINDGIIGKFSMLAGTYCDQYQEGKYQIDFSRAGLSLTTVRHELYHIAKRDCEDEGFMVSVLGKKFRINPKLFLIDEPRAELYSVTGIKL